MLQRLSPKIECQLIIVRSMLYVASDARLRLYQQAEFLNSVAKIGINRNEYFKIRQRKHNFIFT